MTKTCIKCGREGTRQFTYNTLANGYTCDDYAACAKRVPTPTDRQRMEEYRAEMNRLRLTLKSVAAQRDALAYELLNSAWNRDSARWTLAHDYRGIGTILTDLVESGNVDDIHGFLS